MNYVRDEHWEHGERETQDVEEGESNKGFVSRKPFVRVVAIHQGISSKCSKSYL